MVHDNLYMTATLRREDLMTSPCLEGLCASYMHATIDKEERRQSLDAYTRLTLC